MEDLAAELEDKESSVYARCDEHLSTLREAKQSLLYKSKKSRHRNYY